MLYFICTDLKLINLQCNVMVYRNLRKIIFKQYHIYWMGQYNFFNKIKIWLLVEEICLQFLFLVYPLLCSLYHSLTYVSQV